MVGNKLQFAVVREDPLVEAELLRRVGGDKGIFLIGSAGCTALTLRGQFPDAAIVLLDPNPVQLNLIKQKFEVLSSASSEVKKRAFSIGLDDPNSLTTSGNFESLFRLLRDFIYEFVCGREEWLKFFTDPDYSFSLDEKVFKSPYWAVAFNLFFSDSILVAMFGNAAIQHAPSGSYPDYFRRVFEIGLNREDAKTNYFLHHVLLGHYLDRPNCIPPYFSHPTNSSKTFEFIEAFAQEAPNFSRFDVVSLSNIFDWMDVDEVSIVARRLVAEMRPGAYVVYRQLNNYDDFRKLFSPAFQFDEVLAKDLHTKDKSLFYSSLNIGRKI